MKRGLVPLTRGLVTVLKDNITWLRKQAEENKNKKCIEIPGNHLTGVTLASSAKSLSLSIPRFQIFAPKRGPKARP